MAAELVFFLRSLSILFVSATLLALGHNPRGALHSLSHTGRAQQTTLRDTGGPVLAPPSHQIRPSLSGDDLCACQQITSPFNVCAMCRIRLPIVLNSPTL
jgi:hypothetical protein